MIESQSRVGVSKSSLELQHIATTLQPLRTMTAGMDEIEEHTRWRLLAQLPLRLTCGVPLAPFRVRDLLGLEIGQTLQTIWLGTDDVPLMVGSVQLGWSEFEVVEQQMALRLTRLA